MRKLTDAEIEHFDFTGLVPDLNVAVNRQKVLTVVKTNAKSKPMVKFPRKRRVAA